jgi:hypothetical protein
MDRIKWIEHEGRRILFEDMSGLRDSADICAVSDASTALICKEPESSVLLITDVTDAHYNPHVVKPAQGEHQTDHSPHEGLRSGGNHGTDAGGSAQRGDVH